MVHACVCRYACQYMCICTMSGVFLYCSPSYFERFFCVYVHVFVGRCLLGSACGGQQRGYWIPWNWGYRKLWAVCWEPNLRLLKEKQALWTDEFSLQLHPFYISRQGLSLNLEVINRLAGQQAIMQSPSLPHPQMPCQAFYVDNGTQHSCSSLSFQNLLLEERGPYQSDRSNFNNSNFYHFKLCVHVYGGLYACKCRFLQGSKVLSPGAEVVGSWATLCGCWKPN